MSDVEAAKQTEKASTEASVKPTKVNRGGKKKSRNPLHILFSLALAAGLGYVGYEGYLLKQTIATTHDSLRSSDQQVLDATSAINSHLDGLQAKITENQQALEVLNNSIARMDSLQQQINQLGQTVSGASEAEKALWQIQELEFLLRMADERILLSNDITSATALLKAVDRQLQQINRVGVDDVRTAIARDLLSLNMASQVDVVGLYSRVVAVVSKRQSLTLNTESSKTDVSDIEPLSWWQDVFMAIGIRYTESEGDRVVPQSDAYYVGRSIDFMLEESLFALSQGNNDLWSMSLDRAHTMIEQSYQNDAVKTALQSEISVLSKVNIKPSKVEIGAAEASLQAFKMTLTEAN